MLLSALVAGYLGLLLVRFGLSARFLARRDEGAALNDGPEPVATILQPILSGDPALEACLAANLQAHPQARFLWLLDTDDAEGRACAERVATNAANVTLLLGPPPADGDNPKSVKLARALSHVETPWTAVLDDDTVLPPGALRRASAALRRGGIACGLPIYAAGPGPWSRLVAGFVNGASLLTYPAAAELGVLRTLNGMFYMVRTDELRSLGGFEAIAGQLTDDYAMAMLYLRAGLPLIQTTIIHPVTTTVAGASDYTKLMRRWMVFANRYVRENCNPFTLGLVGVSTLAPLPLMVAALVLDDLSAATALIAVITLKVCGLAVLRRRYAGIEPSVADALAEVAADFLTPLHVAAATLQARRISWRSRSLRLVGGAITYE